MGINKIYILHITIPPIKTEEMKEQRDTQHQEYLPIF